MLTGTTETAIRALLALGLEGSGEPLPPRRLAARLHCSPSYLAKILGTLAKAGLLRSVRGARGGVLLARPAAEITLLAAVEACQGMVVGDYCRSVDLPGVAVCAFHRAMAEVHRATVAALARWTLADLLADPVGDRPAAGGPPCKMRFEEWERRRPPAPEAR
jgi:Rrf2 family protein